MSREMNLIEFPSSPLEEGEIRSPIQVRIPQYNETEIEYIDFSPPIVQYPPPQNSDFPQNLSNKSPQLEKSRYSTSDRDNFTKSNQFHFS